MEVMSPRTTRLYTRTQRPVVASHTYTKDGGIGSDECVAAAGELQARLP